MTDPAGGGLDVPLSPVRPAGADRWRARVALVAVLVIAGTGLGLAVLSREDVRTATVPSPRRSPPAVAPSSSPTASADLPTPTASNGRNEFLPTLPNQPLLGAPTPLVVRRDGDDATLLGWTSGEHGLHDIRRFPGAFAGLPTGNFFVRVAPDALSLLVWTVEPGSIDNPSSARLVLAGGGTAWTVDDVNNAGNVVWAADSRTVALTGQEETWLLASVDARGDWTTRLVDVATDAGPTAEASPSPSSSAPPNRLLSPIGFSVDGNWLYGGWFDFRTRIAQPSIRVRLTDLAVEPVRGAPAAGPERIDTEEGGPIDPTTGRTVAFGPNASIPGGPLSIEVHEADGTVAFRVETGAVIATSWTVDGSLIVMDADGIPYANSIKLRQVSDEGANVVTLLETGPMAGGGLFGIANGYVVFALVAEQPTRAAEIVLMRLADGVTSAIVFGPDETNSVIGIGLQR